MEQINKKLHNKDSEFLNIQIPITNTFSNTNRNEIITENFIENETKKSIQEIFDNERFQVIPFKNNILDKVTYNINLFKNNSFDNKLSTASYSNDDVKFNRKNFINSFIHFEIYNDTNLTTQNRIYDYTISLKLKNDDYIKNYNNFVIGVKDVTQINLAFETYNPHKYTLYNNEGYFLYLLKNDLPELNSNKFLYVKANFKNAKTGLSYKLNTKGLGLNLSNIEESSFFKIKIINQDSIYYYEINEEINLFETIIL